MSHKIGLSVPVPQMLPVTGSWVLPFAVYQGILAARVSNERIKAKKWLGDRTNSTSSDDDPVLTTTRAHANFVESVPLAFIIAGIAELNGAKRSYLNYALAALFAARVAHVELGLKLKDAMGQGRLIGYLSTQAFITGVAGWSAWLVKEYWGF